MAKDNRKIAQDVLAAVGGAENVTAATHCMTRLRLNLKDESIPQIDQVTKIEGVIGAQWSGGQFQVIIGQNVPKVYAEVMTMGVKGAAEAADAPKEKLTIKTVGPKILNYLSKSMVGLIPMMLTAAMFRTIGVVIGPDMLNLVSADSQTYILFYDWLYNAGFYFLPFYLGYTAAKTIGATPVLGMMLGGILMAPELMTLVEGGETTTMVYGFIPAAAADYSTTVLPVLLAVAVLAPVEKFFKKVVPDMLSTVFVPFLTIAVMVPVTLCLLAPIGNTFGILIGNALFALGNAGGIWTALTAVILGAAWMFLVMTGMHVVLITFGISAMAANGADACILMTLLIANASVWGIALGAFLKLKNKSEKGEMLGFFLAGLCGGVTEPTLFGCGFKYTRTLVCMAIGGAAGSLFAVLLGAKAYVLTSTNLLMSLAFVGGDMMGLIGGIGSLFVAVGVSCALTYLFGFTSEQLEEDRVAAAEHEAKLAQLEPAFDAA